MLRGFSLGPENGLWSVMFQFPETTWSYWVYTVPEGLISIYFFKETSMLYLF